MGMQCTFSYHDLTDLGNCDSVHDKDSDTWSVVVYLPHNQGQIVFGLVVPEDKQADNHFCYFDCGRLDATRTAMFRFLIENRICFNCS